jgi:hypothetical protein
MQPLHLLLLAAGLSSVGTFAQQQQQQNQNNNQNQNQNQNNNGQQNNNNELNLQQNAKSTKNMGPRLLQDCGCHSFIQMATRCQSLNPNDSNAHNQCICDNSWYLDSMQCRDCVLHASGGTDQEIKFYEGFRTTIAQTFTACTNPGASVKVAREQGVCGWSSYAGFACVGFNVAKGEGWSSLENRDTGEIKWGSAKVEALRDMGADPSTRNTNSDGVQIHDVNANNNKQNGNNNNNKNADSVTPEISGGENAYNQFSAASQLASPAGFGSSLALAGAIALLVTVF